MRDAQQRYHAHGRGRDDLLRVARLAEVEFGRLAVLALEKAGGVAQEAANGR
jgi:hypothetical protein